MKTEKKKKKRGKLHRPGVTDNFSSFSKIRRIKHIVNCWKELKITSSDDAIIRIKNILED